jgi:hypothetical protein
MNKHIIRVSSPPKHPIRDHVLAIAGRTALVSAGVLILSCILAPIFVNDHDNSLLALAVLCYVAAFVLGVFGLVWIMDGVREFQWESKESETDHEES